MAFEQSQPLADGTRVAGADLSAAQYHLVKLDTDGTVILTAAVTDVPYGVLQNAPGAGEEAAVLLLGITQVVAGGQVDIGDVIGTNDAGRAVVKTVGTDITHYAIGTVIDGAGADGVYATAAVACVPPTRAA